MKVKTYNADEFKIVFDGVELSPSTFAGGELLVNGESKPSDYVIQKGDTLAFGTLDTARRDPRLDGREPLVAVPQLPRLSKLPYPGVDLDRLHREMVMRLDGIGQG